eukprot:CAMPEP_0185032342 /NCGR_PEP_ID=MMETSP1103-20130426/20321_1 /TAXON_ID=36769 /ORGANISM="Paraphysomonas bandaiensis, Strain Caron Lab Isolate" /LENGTH=1063 /DNA_ID=CAMNT_0027568195 /DNA_START=198 /DNA_END=3389 /DNA_ORIENTATION=+
MAIVGAGPAGTSIIVRAIHLGFESELFSQKTTAENGEPVQYGGVCMFDMCSRASIGGGRLQHYKINSNTNGSKFVTNITQDRPNALPPEIATGTVLEPLGKSKISQFLQEYKSTTAALSDIGKFLVEVGEVVMHAVEAFPQDSAIHCNTEVTRLQQSADKKTWKITALNLSTKTMFEVHSKVVVLASGGYQALPRLPNSLHNKKLMTSDHVCTELGINDLIHKLRNYNRKRIVIIGGAHSAFSAAWICLNKLGWNKDTDNSVTFPGTANQYPHCIYIIHRTAVKVFYSCKKDADKDKYTSYDGVNKQGQIHAFSGLRGDAKNLYRNIRTGIETRVRMLAVGADGTHHQTMYTRLCDEAHVIIWACGYGANTSYSIVDSTDKPIDVYYKRGQVEVNDAAEVLSLKHDSMASESQSPLPVGNLLATGLGFGLNVSGDTGGGGMSKADGVAVYLKRAATLILSHVLGTKVFGDGITSWEQHVSENVKRWMDLQAAKAEEEREDNSDLETTSRANSPVVKRSNNGSPVKFLESTSSSSRRLVRTASEADKKNRRNFRNRVSSPTSPPHKPNAIVQRLTPSPIQTSRRPVTVVQQSPSQSEGCNPSTSTLTAKLSEMDNKATVSCLSGATSPLSSDTPRSAPGIDMITTGTSDIGISNCTAVVVDGSGSSISYDVSNNTLNPVPCVDSSGPPSDSTMNNYPNGLNEEISQQKESVERLCKPKLPERQTSSSPPAYTLLDPSFGGAEVSLAIPLSVVTPVRKKSGINPSVSSRTNVESTPPLQSTIASARSHQNELFTVAPPVQNKPVSFSPMTAAVQKRTALTPENNVDVVSTDMSTEQVSNSRRGNRSGTPFENAHDRKIAALIIGHKKDNKITEESLWAFKSDVAKAKVKDRVSNRLNNGIRNIHKVYESSNSKAPKNSTNDKRHHRAEAPRIQVSGTRKSDFRGGRRPKTSSDGGSTSLMSQSLPGPRMIDVISAERRHKPNLNGAVLFSPRATSVNASSGGSRSGSCPNQGSNSDVEKLPSIVNYHQVDGDTKHVTSLKGVKKLLIVKAGPDSDKNVTQNTMGS